MKEMRYVTVAEMAGIDRWTIESGVPARELMENAGCAVAGEVFAAGAVGRVLVVAGYGNNGGDGLVVARLLLERGYEVRTVLAGVPRPFRPETAWHERRLAAAGGAPERIATVGESAAFFARAPVPGVVVDAVFGVGARGPLAEFHRDLFRRLNRLGKGGALVISVDVPSGLDADTGRTLGACVCAGCTVTMGYPKAGFRNPAAAGYLGRVVTADIGLLPPLETATPAGAGFR